MTLERWGELHAPIFYRGPQFSSRGRAAIVAEQIRRELAALHPRLSDSRFVAIEGKGPDSYIYIPRVYHVWQPADGSVEAITAEFDKVVAELKKDLEIP